MIDKEEKNLVLVGLVVSAFIALLSWNLMGFALGFSYLLLIYIPGLFWISSLDASFIEKFVLLHVIGLAFIPFVYYLIGVSGLPINFTTVALPPLLVFLSGYVFKTKRHKRVTQKEDYVSSNNDSPEQ